MLSRFISGGMRLWARRIFSFFLGQGAIQCVNLLCGFLFIRWLSVEAFAQYSLAFGFQSTVGILVDLGVSGSIVALVGQRGDDPAVIGGFIRSAKRYRAMLFTGVLPVAAIAFFWMTARQHWNPWTQAGLFASVVLSLYYQGISAYYGAALLIQHRLGPFYRAQLSSSLARLCAGALLRWASALGSVATAWIGSLSLALSASLYQSAARPLVREPGRSVPALNKELTQYLGPVAPGIIFYALQGQLTLFLITWFGKSQNIAEVAALGRLTQALILLGAFNGVIVEPYIARLPLVRLPRRYALIFSGGLFVTIALTAVIFLFPSAMLWIIGRKYAHLRRELSWSIIAWGLNYLGGLMWTMHTARKWVFWWHTGLYIVLLTVVQAVGVRWLDMSTTTGIFQFSILTAAASLVVTVIGGMAGYISESRGRLPHQAVAMVAEGIAA